MGMLTFLEALGMCCKKKKKRKKERKKRKRPFLRSTEAFLKGDKKAERFQLCSVYDTRAFKTHFKACWLKQHSPKGVITAQPVPRPTHKKACFEKLGFLMQAFSLSFKASCFSLWESGLHSWLWGYKKVWAYLARSLMSEVSWSVSLFFMKGFVAGIQNLMLHPSLLGFEQPWGS